jgi:predicted DCC family thiol-disulfide oxidoreductase YuxK
MKERSMTNAVILFDGECSLCDMSVRFIVERDRDGYFKYASLQSDTGKRLGAVCENPGAMDSVVLIEEGRCYTRSTAALRIMRRLDGPWPALAVLLVFPRPIRDGVYSFISKRRYDWFGKEELCRLPTPAERDRFIDADEVEA